MLVVTLARRRDETRACIAESELRLVEVTTRMRIAVGDSRKTATGIRSDERFRR